jgi:putative membrane protein
MNSMLTYKALHLIFMVTWFAALFYLPRLFVYHAESRDQDEPSRSILQGQYKIMEKRLWFGIAWPSMILLLIFGTLMLVTNPALLGETWMKIKLVFVIGLVAYHFACHMMFKKFQNGTDTYSSGQMRLWNEVATIFLVAIIFVATVGRFDAFSWIWGVVGLIGFTLLLVLAIKIYKRIRESKSK